MGGRAVRRGAGRHPHAAHGRLRAGAADPGGRGRRPERPHAGGRRHRQRHEGRGRALYRRRHGRLSGQAGQHRAAAHHAGALATDPERARANVRKTGANRRGARSRRACGLAWRRSRRDRFAVEKFRDTAIEAEREIDAASRAGNLATWPRPRTSSKARRRRSVPPASPRPRRRSSRRAKPATGPAAATCWPARGAKLCGTPVWISRDPADRRNLGRHSRRFIASPLHQDHDKIRLSTQGIKTGKGAERNSAVRRCALRKNLNQARLLMGH